MKNFLLLLTISLSSTLFSQQETIQEENNNSKIIKNQVISAKNAVVIWEEDFSGGFPSGWSTYSLNTGAGNNGAASPGNTAECPWKHSFQGSWGYWNSVGTSGGNPTGPAAPINSTTASNGFLISDIDSANHWNGNPGSSSGSSYHFIESYFTTSAIDLSGFTNVSLEFEHSFRLNNSVDLSVSVSVDSINWTTYNVQGNATNNQASADPEILSLNISSVASNSATTYIKIGWNARVYFWMIDDMKIVETPDNKLDLTEITHGGWYTTPTSEGFGLDYTLTPLNQAIENPFTFEGIVANLGALNQTTHINVEVTDNVGLNVFSSISADSLMSAQDTNIFVAIDKFTPSYISQYDYKIWASSPDTISDTMENTFFVTENIYARDDGTDYSEYGLGRSCGGMVIGTYFDIYDTDDLSSLSVFIKDNSVPGAMIYAVIYEIDPSTNDKIFLTQSDDYSITSSDLGGWATISFDDDFQMIPGTYMAAVGSYANPVDTSILGMSQYTYATTCYIQKNGCLSSGQTYGNWYWLSRVPMVRMNFAIVSSFNNSQKSEEVYSVYPNPSNGILHVDIANDKSETYYISITNIIGEEVFSKQVITSGFYSDRIPLEKLEDGVYMVNIISKLHSFTDRIIINK